MNVSTQTVIEIGALVGSLIGGLAWAFRTLIRSQDERVHDLLNERDYWRDVVLKEQSLPEWEAWQEHRRHLTD
jgi:hypothetical protein